MSSKKIGIALAAFQPTKKFFLSQLQSIQKQTYPYWICCIQFDSQWTDLIADPDFKTIFADKRFIWNQNQERLGLAKNFIRAASHATAQRVDYLAFCDQDDIWYPNKLQILVQEMQNLPAMSLLHHNLRVVDADGQVRALLWQLERRKTAHQSTLDLILRNTVTGSASIMDANLLEKFSQIPDNFEYHDYWFALMASGQGGVYALDYVLGDYRQHAHNYIGTNAKQSIERGIKAVVKKNFQQSLQLNHIARKNNLFCSTGKNMFERFDLGLSLFLYGLLHLISDPVLARACFTRALGKFLLRGNC